MKINKLFLFAVIYAVLGFSAVNFLPPKATPKVESATSSIPVKMYIVEQVIIFGKNTPDDAQMVEIKEGDTVLDVLINTKNPEIKEYSFGKSVESINGVKNGENKKYWLYSVNGKESAVGAGEYILNENDKITWELK